MTTAQREALWTPEAVAARRAEGPQSAAVLCPGPTLRETWEPGRRKYAVTIAVNSACLFQGRPDWLCILDEGPFGACRKPRVGILTKLDKRAAIQAGTLPVTEPTAEGFAGGKRVSLKGLELLDTGVLPARHRPTESLGCLQLSGLAGVGLAAYLGAVAIDVYGADMDGQTYYDGRPMSGDTGRSKRWDAEKRKFEQMTGHLAEFGVTVARVTSSRPVAAGRAASRRTSRPSSARPFR